MPSKKSSDGRRLATALCLQFAIGLCFWPVGCSRSSSDLGSDRKSSEGVQADSRAAGQDTLEQLLAVDADDDKLQSTDEILERIGALIQQGMQANPPDYGMMIRAGNLAGKLLNGNVELDESGKRVIAAALYNKACGLARKSHSTQALATLSSAIKVGFADKELVEKDPDLNGLRGDEQYKKLLEELAVAERMHLEAEVDAALAGTNPFPFSFELESMEGEKTSLEQLRGSKVTVVDIWGTWCPPCRMEIPHFVDLYSELKPQGLQIVGVTYERGEKEDYLPKLKSFAQESSIQYPLVLGDQATQRQIPGFRGYPTTLFLDSQGIVRAVTVGYHSKEVLKGIIERLMKAS